MEEWLGTPLIIVAVLAVVGFIGGNGTFIWKASRWVAGVDNDRAGLQPFMEEIRKDIKEIFLRLPPVPVSGNSPLKLTDFGEKIAAKIEAPEWARELAPTVAHEVAGKRPFEIDEFSQEFVITRLGEQWEARVAGCAYDFGIKRDGVRDVLRVVLRDELIRLAGPPEEAP